MICESCNRNSVVKSYCYLSNNPEYFKYIYNEEFSVVAFVCYAIEVELSWKTRPTCDIRKTEELRSIWEMLEPLLKKALREYKLSQGSAM